MTSKTEPKKEIEEYREAVIEKANYLLQETYSAKQIERIEYEIDRLENKSNGILRKISILKQGNIMKTNFKEWLQLLDEQKLLEKEINFEQLKLDYMKKHIED